MNAVVTETGAAILELLEREACAINMTGLVQLLPDHPEPELKRLANDLYMQGAIFRVPVMAPRGAYHAFYAKSVRTANGRAQLEQLAQPDPQQLAPLPAALSPEEAVNVLERGGWKAEPEVTEPVTLIPVERRGPDRRRLTALEVIKRWRLAYPLARVVDLIGGSRRGTMSRDDAALAIRMLREHVRGDE